MRSDEFDAAIIKKWLADYGIDAILNQKSATWRGLSEDHRAQMESDAVRVILSNPAMLKRPVLDFADHILTAKDALNWLEAA